jgi:hypothetical protein
MAANPPVRERQKARRGSQRRKGSAGHSIAAKKEFPMPYLPPDEAKDLLAGILVDFAEYDLPNLGRYLEHVGFDAGAISTSGELLPAWLGHYRIGQGTYDTDRAAKDLLTWPPIARHVFEMQESLAK